MSLLSAYYDLPRYEAVVPDSALVFMIAGVAHWEYTSAALEYVGGGVPTDEGRLFMYVLSLCSLASSGFSAVCVSK